VIITIAEDFFQAVERKQSSDHQRTYASSRLLFVPRCAAVRLSRHCGERYPLIFNDMNLRRRFAKYGQDFFLAALKAKTLPGKAHKIRFNYYERLLARPSRRQLPAGESMEELILLYQ